MSYAAANSGSQISVEHANMQTIRDFTYLFTYWLASTQDYSPVTKSELRSGQTQCSVAVVPWRDVIVRRLVLVCSEQRLTSQWWTTVVVMVQAVQCPAIVSNTHVIQIAQVMLYIKHTDTWDCPVVVEEYLYGRIKPEVTMSPGHT